MRAGFTSPDSRAVEIDGKLEPDEWRDAKSVSEFRNVVPLTGDPASLATEGWILATPQGLAVAFRNHHPASVPRTEQRVQRDFEEEVDRVNVMIDFDGDGRVGHAFTLSSTGGIYDAIISNERDFNEDWDGNWRHAVLRAANLSLAASQAACYHVCRRSLRARTSDLQHERQAS